VAIFLRILQDQSSSTGFQTQALDTLQDKLNEVESALRRETEMHRKSQVRDNISDT
jgi:hypothetical protein